jgi:hypothetical protein
MSMPSGDSPQKAEQYYRYLQGHQLAPHPHGRLATWHVDWVALAWMWGFTIVLVLLLLLWVKQYRTTRQPRAWISPLDDWGGWTSEQARPATGFFWFLLVVLVASTAVIAVGHLISGQKF